MTDPVVAPVVAPTTPWHQGVEAETLGFWQNKGYDLTDQKAFATKITEHYRNAEKHLGVPQDRILRLPEKADDADGWKAIHQRLGAPKDAKEYDFTGIKFTDGTELDEGFTTSMRSELLKANVAKDKAPDIVKAVIKHLDDADKAEATIRESEKKNQIEKVLKDWGAHRQENELLSLQALKRLEISQPEYDKLAGVIGYDRAAEIFRKIGAGFKEPGYVEGVTPGAPTTAASAQARLAELENDPGWRAKLVKHDAATWREFRALSEQIAAAA
jgi:hypothetical protein